MLFKKIYMHGFKSFADPVTIELNNGITCVVGPNGTGKSNISDALRWVLGEQSPKQLRGGKMEEIIFAGTRTRKPKGMAEVTLVIDNSDKSLPIEYSEVAVTRRMYRSGENEYSINGNQCRLRDIRELFMDTGIGVEGYSIIGQGKIAELVSTKPENRREVFEEAAGIVMYKTRKADAERKLKSAGENLERVRDIISEIEGRIEGLKSDSDKAKEYIKLRERYKYLSINIILHDLAAIDKNLITSRDDLLETKKSLDENNGRICRINKELEAGRQKEDELNEAHDSSNFLLIDKINELNKISNRGELDTARLTQIKKDIERLTKTINDNKSKLEIEVNNFRNFESIEKEIDKELEEAVRFLNDASNVLKDHRNKLDIINSEVEKNKNEIIDLTGECTQKNAEINTLSNYLLTLNSRKDEVIKDYQSKDERFISNKRELKEIKQSFDNKINEIKIVTEKINETKIRLTDLITKSENLNREINDNLTRQSMVSSRRNTLKELENSYDGYNNAVKSLMKNNPKGIIGTVSDLISVPDGYELAIETALGSQMQNIVCDDDFAAKEAVRWLKSTKSGRATFLPIKSIFGKEIALENGVKNINGFLGIASEIVKCEGKFDNVINYLLGKVIVANSMDDAISISKIRSGASRIVTLDGDVINSGGAITGGRFKHKTANILARKKEIEILSEELESLIKDEKKLNNEKQSVEATIASLKDERTSKFDLLRELEIERNVLSRDHDHMNEIVDSAKEAEDKFERDVRNIDGDIENASKLINKYKDEISTNELAIKVLNDKTEELIDQAETYRKVIDEDNEKIVSYRLEVNNQENRKLANNELIERIRDTITDYEDLIEIANKELDTFREEKSSLTDSSEEAGEKETALKLEKEDLEQKLSLLSRELEENKAKYNSNISLQKEISAKVSQLQDQAHRLELKITKYETVMDSQKSKLWDEFEMSYAEALDVKDESFGITAGNKEIKDVRTNISNLGEVNIGAIEEYDQVSKRYEFMTTQEVDIMSAISELNHIITGMEKTIRIKFKDNFDKVVVYFEEMFKELFGGGTAELRLEDENNPLESGIEIIAQPPGKKLKNINLMSGGEKTLIGVALMFAVLKAKPTPFCILDEVEAALDESNIEKFGNCLKRFNDVQFAIITHQKATMEHADVLYGVTMPEQGISKLLSLKLSDEIN